jgi:lipid-A-disaccharide synthase
MPEIFISAGEASGDHYGAQLQIEIRKRIPDATFFGLGGHEMAAAGLDRVVRAEDVAHMGITEVIRHAPYIYGQLRKLKLSLKQRRPRLAVMIDFPDVNFRLARHCHQLGIPVLWLVSPQLWAWKKRRLRWVRRWVTKMLVIFPFEEPFYRQRGVDAEFIGHPLADLPLPSMSRQDYAAQFGLDTAKQWIALLPGSRAKEFSLHYRTMLASANLLGADYEYLVPVASTLDPSVVSRYMQSAQESVQSPSPSTIRPKIVPDARAALFHARASVIASGTATIQAALMGNPFLIVYKMSPLSYALARRFVSVKFAGMPNLIAGREIVPELLQDQFTAERVVERLKPLLADTSARRQMQTDMAEVQAALTLPQLSLPNTAARTDNVSSATAMARAADAAIALLKSVPLKSRQ